MKSYSASISIRASKDAIWRILTDAQAYPSWEPSTIRIEGTIAAGARVTAYTKLSPNRAFPAKITEFVPGQHMTWVGGMPFGLFKGVRTFTLTPKGDGSFDFTLRESFSGPLLGLMGGSVPDMTETFANFAAALKQRAERG
jgi:hypothetical protein